MEKLLQRVVVLQEYNEQFSNENNQLREQVQQLEQNVEKLQSKMEVCENCQQLAAEIKILKKHKHELDTDLAMLKNLVYRLNVQIESYQDQQRRKQQQQLNTAETGAGDTAQQNVRTYQTERWEFAAPLYTHTLGPLLRAYDELIRDKEDLFQQYKQEFEHFTGELKRVLEEHNALLQQHETLKRDVGSWREERTRLQAAVEICRKKAEAHAQKADIAKEKLVEVVQVYEQRLQSLGLEVEHVQSAYSRCKSELTQLKSLQAQPQDTIVSSLQQCKELLERLKQEHVTEKQQLQQQIGDLTKRSIDNEAKVKTLRHENVSLKQQVHQQLESITKLKSELEHTERSRARLKARLRIAFQWAQKLEKGQSDLQGTWDALKRLETIVKHKEAQVRNLHARHMEEMDKMQKKLITKEETIRNILKSKVTPLHLQRKSAKDKPVESEDSS